MTIFTNASDALASLRDFAAAHPDNRNPYVETAGCVYGDDKGNHCLFGAWFISLGFPYTQRWELNNADDLALELGVVPDKVTKFWDLQVAADSSLGGDSDDGRPVPWGTLLPEIEHAIEVES